MEEEIDFESMISSVSANPLVANCCQGLFFADGFHMAPLIWAALEAAQICFPLWFGLYLMVYHSLPQAEPDMTAVLESIMDENEMDAYKDIYASFIDDSRASSDLNDIEKIKIIGYDKFRYVSQSFLKRNRLGDFANAMLPSSSSRSKLGFTEYEVKRQKEIAVVKNVLPKASTIPKPKLNPQFKLEPKLERTAKRRKTKKEKGKVKHKDKTHEKSYKATKKSDSFSFAWKRGRGKGTSKYNCGLKSGKR